MSYTDAQMVLATQVAYLNCNANGNRTQNVGELVDAILQQYGTYDRKSGQYVVKDGVSNAAKAQFKTAQTIIEMSEKTNTYSWKDWTIIDSCNRQNGSGYYGCMIETGDREAIIACRGSESFDLSQKVKDWGESDFGRLNNEQTRQQADATEYMNYLEKKYGTDYDSYSFTGHSLGGSLATHAAITAPKEMQDKTERVVSYDGPGFSDEYLKKHADQIDRVRDKLSHYQYSGIGSLLLQPKGIENRVIKAHDDKDAFPIFAPQLFRHSTKNIEFDENGNVMDGDRDILQSMWGPLTACLDLLPKWMTNSAIGSFVVMVLAVYGVSVLGQIWETAEDVAEYIEGKMMELYDNYLSSVVSGNYEVYTRELCSMSSELENTKGKLEQIADQVRVIQRSLPYDSVSAYYYKHCLGVISNSLHSDGKKLGKISKVADRAACKYEQGDLRVSELF